MTTPNVVASMIWLGLSAGNIRPCESGKAPSACAAALPSATQEPATSAAIIGRYINAHIRLLGHPRPPRIVGPRLTSEADVSRFSGVIGVPTVASGQRRRAGERGRQR